MFNVRVLVAFLFAISSLPSVAQESLSVIALRDWYSGISIDGTTETGKAFKAFHAPDGKISALYDGQHKNSGTWKIVEPGHACISWSNTAWGRNPCYAVFKDGELWKLVRVDDARVFTTVKRVEGNPFGL